VLPATSVHVPVTEAVWLSGVEYVAVVHESMPDVGWLALSLPENSTSTGSRYQPLASGTRLGVPVMAAGAVLSILTVALAGTQTGIPSGRPSVTSHTQVVMPSFVICAPDGQFRVSTTGGINGDHASVTFVLCHPLQSDGPGVQV
jgi:hypothetical protein